MIPIAGNSSEPNGFVAIATSDPSLGTSSSSTMETIVIAASKARPLSNSSTKLPIAQYCHPQRSACRTLTTFQTERSPSSVSSGVTGSWISLENSLSFPSPLSIRMCKLKSLLACIKFRSTPVMTWSPLYHTDYRHGSLRILKWVTYVLIHPKRKIG